MGLIDSLRKADKKGLFKSADSFASYSTGFLPLDYANGFIYNHLNDGKLSDTIRDKLYIILLVIIPG